jgi:hypothetical protein
MRNRLTVLILPSALLVSSCASGVDDLSAPDPGAAEPAIGVQSEALCGAPVRPARCGPRNCVAMCVTCLYDLCRAHGGSCTDCRHDMELCKDDCNEQECPPSDPFCDF